MEKDRDLDSAHARPAAASDELVAAVGRVSEALEWIERARGRLYDFHQFTGHAHLLLGQAAQDLRAAGATDRADQIDREIVGLNVLEGRWTFQIVEEYDDGYYRQMRDLLDQVTEELMSGQRHVLEAEMKQRLRTPGVPGHEATPRRP